MRGGDSAWRCESDVFCDIPVQTPIDKARQEEYIEELLIIDGREQCLDESAEQDEEENQEQEEEAMARKRNSTGGSAKGSAASRKSAISRNRLPFVKSLDTKQHFTRKELQQHLSADCEVIYESRWTSCVRVVEDDFQLYTNKLTFGIHIHHCVGNVLVQQIKSNTYHIF
jgi:hypothetical protein